MAEPEIFLESICGVNVGALPPGSYNKPDASETVRRKLTEWCAGHVTKPKIVLDCTGVTFMDVYLMDALRTLGTHCQKHGGKLVLFGLAEDIKRVMEITHAIPDLMRVCDSRTTALQSLQI